MSRPAPQPTRPRSSRREEALTPASAPNGWQWVKIGDLAETCSGTTPPRGNIGYYGGRIPWVKTGELVDAEIHDTEEHVTEKALEETSLRLLPKGTLLVAMYGQGQTRGRTGLLKTEATTNQACFAILPNERFAPEFIQLWFCHSYQRLRQQTEGRGGNQSNFNGSVLREESVPLPPLAEQRRMAGRLREQMAGVARARAAVAAQLAAAAALPAALLRAHFTTPAAQRWPRHRLGDATDISSGITLGRKLNGKPTRPVPYLRVANVKDGWLELSEVKIVEATENEIRDCLLASGDILLTEGGDPDKLGRGTFWQGEVPECIHQNHIFRVRAEAARFEPAFLAYQFGSSYGKAYFLAHAKQTTGIASINKTVLSNFPLRVPPLAEQRAVAARLTAELSAATALRSSLQARLSELERLPAALLRTAFTGES